MAIGDVLAELNNVGKAGAMANQPRIIVPGYQQRNTTIPPPLPPRPPTSASAGGAADAIGGSIIGGAAIGLGLALGKMVFNKLQDTFHKVTNPLETFNKGLDDLEKRLTIVPNTVLHVKDVIVKTSKAWVDALAAPIDVIAQLGHAIGRFTQLSNPGGMRLLEFRIQNAMATIGNTLQPILDALTRSAEEVGDMFARMKPAMEPLARAASSLIDSFTSMGTTIADVALPGLTMLSTAIENIGLIAQNTGILLNPAVTKLARMSSLLGVIAELTGLSRPDAKSDIAVLPPQYRSAEEIVKEQSKNALMASMGVPEKKDAASWLEMLYTWITSNLKPSDIADAIAKVTLHVVKGEAVEAVEEGSRSGLFGPGGIVASRVIPGF